LTPPKDWAPSGPQAAHPEGTGTPAAPSSALSEGGSASALASPAAGDAAAAPVLRIRPATPLVPEMDPGREPVAPPGTHNPGAK
jgi:hypothetical protein